MLPDLVKEHMIMLAQLGAEQLVAKRYASPDLLLDMCDDEEFGNWKVDDEDEEEWSAEFSDGPWTISVLADYKRFFLDVANGAQKWQFMFSIKNDEVVCLKGDTATPEGARLLQICIKAVERELFIQQAVRKGENETLMRAIQFSY